MVTVALRVVGFILIAAMTLQSCKGHFFYEDLYARANRKQRKFLESYPKADSICILKIKLSHEGSIWSRVILKPKIIRDSLKLSFSRFFHFDSCANNKKSILMHHYHSIQGKNNLSCCEKTIIPDLTIISGTGRNLEGGGGLTFVEDMGNDRHDLKFKLVTKIYHKDTLVYMDNMAYWNTIYSARNEKVRYSVPQEVLDSLVSLSLEEYFKRVR